jgi:antitoxin PrlF
VRSGCRDGSRKCRRRQFARGLFANWQIGPSSKPSSQIDALGLRLEGRKALSYITSMNRQTLAAPSFSKVSVKSQTVIPREVRERLGLKPGDTLRYRLTDMGVLLDKAPANEADDPFATFSEWSNAPDEKAYRSL